MMNKGKEDIKNRSDKRGDQEVNKLEDDKEEKERDDDEEEEEEEEEVEGRNGFYLKNSKE